MENSHDCDQRFSNQSRVALNVKMRTKQSTPQPNVGGNEHQQNGGLRKTRARENLN